MAARSVEAEAPLEQLADGQAALRRLAGEGADREVAQPPDQRDDAGEHELLGGKARQRDIAEEGRRDDADGARPERQLQPGRGMARDGRRCPLRRERRQQQAGEEGGDGNAGEERLQHDERQAQAEGAGDLRQDAVEGIDRGDGAEQARHAAHGDVAERAQPPLRLARRQHRRDEGGHRRQYEYALENARCRPAPRVVARDESERVEPDVEQESGGNRRQRAQRRHPGGGDGALEERRQRRLRPEPAPVRPPRQQDPQGRVGQQRRADEQGERVGLVQRPFPPQRGPPLEVVHGARRVRRDLAPDARQHRARLALHQVPGEQGMAHHRDALDQLARAHPGQLARFDGAVEGGVEACEPAALGCHLRRLRRAVLTRGGTELLDLRSNGGKLRTQRLCGLCGGVEHLLHLPAQAGQVLLGLGDALQGFLHLGQHRGPAADRGCDLGGQSGLRRRLHRARLWPARCGGGRRLRGLRGRGRDAGNQRQQQREEGKRKPHPAPSARLRGEGVRPPRAPPGHQLNAGRSATPKAHSLTACPKPCLRENTGGVGSWRMS